MEPIMQPLRWIPGAVSALAITENGRLIVSFDAEPGMNTAPTAFIASLADQRLVPCEDGCVWEFVVGPSNVIFCFLTPLYALVDHGNVFVEESTPHVWTESKPHRRRGIFSLRPTARDPTDGALVTAHYRYYRHRQEFEQFVSKMRPQSGPLVTVATPEHAITNLAVRADGAIFTVDSRFTIKCLNTSISVAMPVAQGVWPDSIVLALRQDAAYVVLNAMFNDDVQARLVRVDLLNGRCKDVCFVPSDTVACVAHRSHLYLRLETIPYAGVETGVVHVALPPDHDMALSARMAAVVLRMI